MSKRNLALLFATSTLTMIFGSLYLAMLPQYTKAHGYDEFFYGVLFSLNMASFVILSMPGGHFSDKVGRKIALTLGWGMQAGAPLLLAITSHWLVLIAASLVWGMGSGLAQNAFWALIADTVKLDRLSRTIGYIHSFSLFITAGTIWGVEAFIIEANDIKYGLILGLVLCIGIALVSALLALFFKEQGWERHEYSLLSMKQFSTWEKHVMRDFAIAQFVIGFGAAMTVPYYNLFFLQKFATPPTVYGLILAFGTAAIGVTQLFSGYVGDKVNKLKYLVFANAIAIPMAFGILLAPTLELAGAFYVERISFANMVWPVWNAYFLGQIARHSRGKAQGMVHIFWNLAYIPGALVGGYVAGINPGLTFPIAAVMYLCVILFVFYDLGGEGESKEKEGH